MAHIDTLDTFNPGTPAYRADPYPVYHHFRARQPVYCASAQDTSGPRRWFLFRYADVAAALKDPRLRRGLQPDADDDARPVLAEERKPFYEMAARWMLYRDPPDHTRLRSLVGKAFTPRMVSRLHPNIVAATNDLLDKAQPHGAMDLMADFAGLLPVVGITELLGLGGHDMAQFSQWSNDLSAALDYNPRPIVYERASAATVAFSSHLQEVIEARRQQPQDDFMSGLIAAEGTDGKLSQDEIIATCILLLGAGQETTVDLIGNAALALLRHPDQLALLRANADVAPGAVEELLRYDSPVQMTARIAAEDLAIGQHTIRRGDRLTLLLGAANRDPEVFQEPDRLDLNRTGTGHLAFGLGIHFCLGAPLARLTAQIALTTLLSRFPALRLESDAPQWLEGPVFRGLKTLPVGF